MSGVECGDCGEDLTLSFGDIDTSGIFGSMAATVIEQHLISATWLKNGQLVIPCLALT
jgi:hypothetical protein